MKILNIISKEILPKCGILITSLSLVKMINLIIKKKNINKSIYLTVISLCVLSIFYINPIESGDTPHYDNQSKLMINFGILDYLYLLITEYERPYFFYLGTIIYTTFFKLLFYDFWKFFFVASNLLLSFYIFYRLYNELSNLIFFKFIFLFLFIFNIEQNQWNYYILGESIFNFLVCLIFFKIVKNFNANSSMKKNLFFFVTISFIIIFTKPSGYFIFGFFIFSYLFLYLNEKKKNIPIFTYFSIFIFFILLIFSIIFSFILQFNLIIIDNNYFNNLYESIITGTIIDSGHSERVYRVDMGNKSVIDFIIYFIFKFFYFFKFWDFNFWSFKHNLVNFIIFIPLYISLVYSFLKFKEFPHKEKKIILVCLAFISSNAIFHTLTFIDFSFRFRLISYCPIYYLLILNLNFIKNKFFSIQSNKV